MRKDVHNKLQENKVREDIKKERARRREKKEIFILQKQTEEAKAYHRKLGKVKQIKKGKGTTEKVKGSRHFRGNKGSFAKPKGRHSR